MHSKRLLRWVLPAFALIVLALPTLAQESALPGSNIAEQSLRPYAFVFIAYAIVWVFVLGWIVAVGRRMSALARRLDA